MQQQVTNLLIFIDHVVTSFEPAGTQFAQSECSLTRICRINFQHIVGITLNMKLQQHALEITEGPNFTKYKKLNSDIILYELNQLIIRYGIHVLCDAYTIYIIQSFTPQYHLHVLRKFSLSCR